MICIEGECPVCGGTVEVCYRKDTHTVGALRNSAEYYAELEQSVCASCDTDWSHDQILEIIEQAKQFWNECCD